jgi:transcriptional regulator GlxA family with amidase domain
MIANEHNKILGFLIFPGFPMSCLTSAIEPLRAANEITGTKAFAWTVIGETGARVTSSAEVGFDPDVALQDIEKIDYLFILSGPLGKFENPKSGNGKLRLLARRGVAMGGFSGGVFPLVRAGLMDGHKCSVHWCYDAAFKTEFPDIAAMDNVITIDRSRYTASGATAVFDLMLKLINDQLGAETMTEVACWFQHPYVRGEDVIQKVPTFKTASTDDMLPRGVVKAIRMFDEHIDDPIQISDVAAAVAMSARQLERSFKRSTGQSPLKYYRMMRMNKARQMVLYSNDTMTEIAIAIGYSSATPMMRNYQEIFGISPSEERKKINTFRVSENIAIPAV